MRHTDDPEAFQKSEQRTDVFAALDDYFAHYNNGRPFILAGHSQGSMMIRIALDEYFPLHPELAERMIAAYAIGESFPKEWLAAHAYVKFAEGADDTGVIISWNTEGPGNKDASNFVVEAGTISINPINWKRDNTYAPASENLGSRSRNEAGAYVVTPGIHDAHLNVERGVVICTTSDSYVPLTNLFGTESLHGGDYDLYCENIRQNAKTRVNAYLAEHGFGYGSFTDLAADEWYREGVEYALSNGIMHGYGNGLFGPNDTVTFEQMGQMPLVLRHSCASLLLDRGVSMKEIQEWLGHSDFSTTANIYAHLDAASKSNTGTAMAGRIDISGSLAAAQSRDTREN